MIDEVMGEVRAAMDKSIKALRKEMTKVRTGRASTALLNDVRVDYYGGPDPSKPGCHAFGTGTTLDNRAALGKESHLRY